MPGATELPANVHFTLYAFEEDASAGRLFEVQQFEIHHIVDLTSPCFIDVGDHVPHPGLHVSQYAKVIEQDTGIPDPMNPPPGASAEQESEAATAVVRQQHVEALAGLVGGNPLKALSDVSTASYPAVGADCTDPSGIPPPTCTDEASNQRRLAMCQQFWHAHPAYFEGTDRVLTAPLDGTVHGMVVGTNPINQGPVGGAQFFVDSDLAGFDGFAIYWQYDDADGDGQPDYPASVPADQQTQLGQLLLFGKPTSPTRGVLHVHMTNPQSPSLTGELAIFADIDQDNVHF